LSQTWVSSDLILYVDLTIITGTSDLKCPLWKSANGWPATCN